MTALPIGALGSNAQALATLLIHIRPKTTIVSAPVGHRKNIDSSPAKSRAAPGTFGGLAPISISVGISYFASLSVRGTFSSSMLNGIGDALSVSAWR